MSITAIVRTPPTTVVALAWILERISGQANPVTAVAQLANYGG